MKLIAILIFCLASLFPQKGGASLAKDELGRRINVPANPQRIVSLAPNITEILYSLGLGDKIVGVSTYSDFPAAAKNKEKVGGFVNPNLEKIVSLKPDLIIGTADGNPSEVINKLAKLNFPVFVIYPKKIDQILCSIVNIGRITGKKGQAREIQKKYEGLMKKISSQKRSQRPRVFVQFQENPIITAAKNTFTDDLITLAGGENIFKDTPIKYPKISVEAVLQKKPEVIIISAYDNDFKKFEKIKENWGSFKEIPAVKNKKIYIISGDFISRPSERIFIGLERLAKLF